MEPNYQHTTFVDCCQARKCITHNVSRILHKPRKALISEINRTYDVANVRKLCALKIWLCTVSKERIMGTWLYDFSSI